MKNLSQERKENEDGTKFWEFCSTRITLPSKVPVIWIAHACDQVVKVKEGWVDLESVLICQLLGLPNE